MYLFERGETTASFKATLDSTKRNIDNLSNEKICGMDLDELEQYYVSENWIEEIQLFKDNITKELSRWVCSNFHNTL